VISARHRAARTVTAASLLGLLLVAVAACGSSSTGGAGTSSAAAPPSTQATSLAGTSSSAGSSEPIQIVAGENFWGNITQQIGGSHVHVTSIITNPNTDPHEYESDPNDAAAVAKAQFVIENGVGYDDFLSKELSAAGGHKQVLNVQQLNGVTGSNPNPHLWYNPSYVLKTASAIESQLATDDPADAASFQAGLAAFETAYQPYLAEIAAIKAKYNGDAISYTERVPGYLVDAAGLHLGTPAAFSQAVEDGTDPTPEDTAIFNSDIKEHKVKVLLYNSQVVDSQTTQIKQTAMSAGIPIVGVSETIPAQYSTFQAWQIAQAKALLAALGG
jgi:zinc/manganese transport system substrate-binding protein